MDSYFFLAKVQKQKVNRIICQSLREKERTSCIPLFSNLKPIPPNKKSEAEGVTLSCQSPLAY